MSHSLKNQRQLLLPSLLKLVSGLQLSSKIIRPCNLELVQFLTRFSLRSKIALACASGQRCFQTASLIYSRWAYSTQIFCSLPHLYLAHKSSTNGSISIVAFRCCAPNEQITPPILLSKPRCNQLMQHFRLTYLIKLMLHMYAARFIQVLVARLILLLAHFIAAVEDHLWHFLHGIQRLRFQQLFPD